MSTSSVILNEIAPRGRSLWMRPRRERSIETDRERGENSCLREPGVSCCVYSDDCEGVFKIIAEPSDVRTSRVDATGEQQVGFASDSIPYLNMAEIGIRRVSPGQRDLLIARCGGQIHNL